MKKLSGIYKIVCLSNLRIYIGSSIDVRKRWSVHRCKLRKTGHHCTHLQRAWNKYGEKNFSFEVVEECCVEQLFSREQFWIDSSDTTELMNTSKEAKFSRLGSKLTKKHKNKIRRVQRSIGKQPEQRKIRSKRAKKQHLEGNFGRKNYPIKNRVCSKCNKEFKPERMPSGNLSQSKFCLECRPIHKGGYYKFERVLQGEGRPRSRYKGV